MAICLVCLSSDHAVQIQALPGDYCVVFLGKTIYSLSASFYLGVQLFNGYRQT